ncbi:MAG: fasciclin domain-containing protein [Bacteroidales bacterium]|nr:fasciclin domain-containing protein [Bacteroidales bacterium]
MKGMHKIRNLMRVGRWYPAAVLTVLLCLIPACELTTEQDVDITYYEENDLSITQYIESDPENFSILSSILDTTRLGHLFRTYGDYTFLAPVNSAFESYFAETGRSSYEDFEMDELIKLIKYHIFNVRFMAGSFNMGIIESKTLTLDYMVSGPSEDGSDIFLNKSAKILARDIILPNGILHTVDKVIVKPELTIYDWLKNNEDTYSIFLEALERTGLDDMAQTMEDAEAGRRYFYTCFATPDEAFAKSNINSFEDLAAFISPGDDRYSDTANALRSFIASQFLTDIISMSDAGEEHEFFGTVGGATLKFGLIPNTAEIALNYGTLDFPDGLNIDEFSSNNLTGNGIIHVMEDMYQVTTTFERITRSFVFLDVPGLPYDSLYDYGITLWEEQGIIAKETGSNGEVGSERWLLGQWSQYWPRPGEGNHIPFERTNGWLTLNAPYSGPIKGDHHRNNEYRPVFFTFEKCDDLLDVTRKFPYIIPGKYRLIHYTKAGPERPSVKHYFDGEPIGGIINLATVGLDFQDVELGIVDIKEDQMEHYLRIQAVTVGKGFYVEIRFEPID